MSIFRRFTACVAALSASMLAGSPAGGSEETSPPRPSAERDGAHDFDFNFGVWTTHIKRLKEPLSGSRDYVEMKGTVSVRKVWDGRAQLEEIEVDAPGGHWEGLTLFLYNPRSHQWSQTFINSAKGTFSEGLIGEFAGGRGELFAQETLWGRSLLVRGVWSDIKPDSHHFEEAYSDDGGKTWEPFFIADLTRAQAADHADTGAQEGSHDFDFDFGTWKTHSSRLRHPLTGSADWADMDGITVVSKVWRGRANLAEYRAEGPAGVVQLLALRVYNPATQEWSIDFATPNAGTLGAVAGVGRFQNGRVDFYDQETINDRAILVRFSLWSVSENEARSEQAFSADGGKSWEVNWRTTYTRSGEPVK